METIKELEGMIRENYNPSSIKAKIKVLRDVLKLIDELYKSPKLYGKPIVTPYFSAKEVNKIIQCKLEELKSKING